MAKSSKTRKHNFGIRFLRMSLKSLAVIFTLLFPEFLFANADLMYPVKAHLTNANKIILGRVTEYSAVTGVLGGEMAICGWALKVEVEHSFRGNTDNITIFTEEFNGFIGTNERYFILVYENGTFQFSGSKRLSKCDYRHWGMMGQPDEYKGDVDISEFKYTTRHPRQNYAPNLFPIDPYLTKKLGGDWLLSRGNLDSLSTHIVNNDENPNHKESYFGVYLFDFLKENWDIINAPKAANNQHD